MSCGLWKLWNVALAHIKNTWKRTTSKKNKASSITIAIDMIKYVRSVLVKHEQFQVESLKAEKASKEDLKRKMVTNGFELVN